ncbi:hypothetical protein CPB86DRAFT_703937 [Serendipita vermifera]|nr:hypothetical protein CPB86DRAFT_703937 [Serendipita vermifera]
MLAISSRVKDEFKLKLNGQFEIPKKNAATEGELMEDLNDINNEIGRRVKDVIRLVSRGEKKGRKSTQFEKETLSLEKSMRTSLNVFLVTHIFTPYSIELDEVDDEKMRKRYDEIAPKVPQMIASRWRVLASASTSRPADQLNPIFTKLASEASDILLEGREADEKVRNEMLAILIPLVQQAYLLAHFIHLEMIESDYDVFFGTEIGGWLNHTLEEDYRVKPKSAMSLEGRIDGHWSLGLRKKRYIGEGTQQRRIWDALVKAKVSTQSG